MFFVRIQIILFAEVYEVACYLPLLLQNLVNTSHHFIWKYFVFSFQIDCFRGNFSKVQIRKVGKGIV